MKQAGAALARGDVAATKRLLEQALGECPDADVLFVTGVTLGRFVRGIHYWGAMAMIVLVGLHLLRVFVSGSFKRPCEGNWIIGVALACARTCPRPGSGTLSAPAAAHDVRRGDRRRDDDRLTVCGALETVASHIGM